MIGGASPCPLTVAGTAKLARAAGTPEVRGFVPTCDEEKLVALRQAGFQAEHRFGATFKIGGKSCDIVVLGLATTIDHIL